jgi:hypothetical protein
MGLTYYNMDLRFRVQVLKLGFGVRAEQLKCWNCDHKATDGCKVYSEARASGGAFWELLDPTMICNQSIHQLTILFPPGMHGLHPFAKDSVNVHMRLTCKPHVDERLD